MSKIFKDLGISEPILKALEEMGFEEATEVQGRSIPPVLKKKDLIVKSKTGSGKTAAFGIPLLQLMNVGEGVTKPQALILTPTRELAVQVDSDLRQISKHLKARTTAVYGQHSINVEVEALNKGVAVVTGTPGRVFDHIRQGNLVTKEIGFLVLDEADRMLDMGFLDQVVRIIKTLPKDRVTLLFSATMPYEIQNICREYMKNPETIEIESDTKTVDAIHQLYHRVESNEKRTQLNRILTVEQPDGCMIFCNTRAAVDRVQEYLSKKGYSSCSLHGEIPQAKRLRTIQSFKKGDFHLLVATDVAARGIHVEDLSLVINYDVPVDKDSYVHRIGRTGRAGSGGKAITMVTSEDIMSLYEIEEHIGAMIAEEDLPSDEIVQAAKAQATVWAGSKVIVDQQLKSTPRTVSTSGVGASIGTSKPSKAKRTQHHERKETRSKSEHRERTQHHDRVEQQSRSPHRERPAQQEKPRHSEQAPKGRVRTIQVGEHKSVATRIPAHGHSHSVHEKVQKKSFLQRILQRITGKA